ncbi:phosphoadenosine phosphosulfate reductase [Protomyces lactucae-debilis]|uniref:Phosphoadenosine phosphosulfate reductase n=1 Tax=Protomyces lactucae-debilis TaxID=2754530 RepID=A0A1Y2ESP5_PROLT|nr:phosphoadenosine phosphosulfate reductase [Protomyces lactucae-debilis]ORY74598.1 phosphoadenosine phosphosulfate reductase [Protomyces lactucae-debilis]
MPSIGLLSAKQPSDMSNHTSDTEDSDYGSASSQVLPDITFTPSHLHFLNQQLSKLSAQEILKWAITTLPGLWQTTAMGLTGMVSLDIISKMSPDGSHQVPLMFIDTLYHFQETLDLAERIRQKYSGAQFAVYTPRDASTAAEFEAVHGPKLWETNEKLYDYLVKVEPARRAYQELGVKAVLTGRRRSQGGARNTTPIIEVDETGLIKVNPLANWSFGDVQAYIKQHSVPYNVLLDRGYRSVGDWHSTVPVAEGEDERAGRWKGREKTECGLHENSKFFQHLAKMQKAKEAKAKLAGVIAPAIQAV